MSPVPPGPLPPGQRRDDLVAEVRRACRPLREGASAVVAVSGGPDSSALAHLVHDARPDLDLHLAHVRHGLRDDERDLAAVRGLAAALDLPLHVTEVTVRPTDQGLQAAARSQRYAALRRIALRVGAGWLLVGHTADDQAETLLLRMARGTGTTGLGGMAPVRGDVVRPLLRLRRGDVRRVVEGLDVAHDPANTDPRFRRARARHEVLPLLERLAPDPVGALGRLADLARADARHLDAVAGDAAAGAARRYGPGRAVPADLLASLPPAIARRLVRHVAAELRGGPPLAAGHVTDVLALEPGQAVDLPGLVASRGGGWVALVPDDLPDGETVHLDVPGVTAWRPSGVSVTAELAAERDGTLPSAPRWAPPDVPVPERAVPPGGDPDLGRILLPRRVLGAPLRVRARRPGDRVATAVGTRKLQDVFVDAGVPRTLRDVVPVVTAGERVVWVPGLVADAELADQGRAAPHLQLAVTAE